ncbi:MAG: UDP-glucose 4-epimerase GalE [Rhodobacteraceae bacterium]|nr:UDP-glucose 4-epimerase GalE [Paracoccaceae bacterium]
MAKRLNVLATGGAGFIGSHVVVELIAAGHGVVILDNFENAAPDVPARLGRITGVDIPTIRADVRDKEMVRRALGRHGIDAVIHLAGKKAVGEAVAQPLLYYDANLGGGVALLEAMQESGVGKLLFSSSATVYGPGAAPMDEDHPVAPSNPYGRTKLMLEEIITDAMAAGAIESAISLRYFNPAGAHPSGLIGEDPRGTPNNLFPFIAQTAAGRHAKVRVFGDDYDTPDGTGVRDYIHVVDLARGHVAALSHLMAAGMPQEHERFNLGTGRGYSVKEALTTFSRACGFQVPYEIVARRAGDVATCVACPDRAARVLGWRAEMTLEQMCADHLAFQREVA